MKICKKVSVVIQAALIAFAIQMRYSAVLNKADFKSELHYLYAEVTNLLGNFGFVGLLLFALAIVFICWISRTTTKNIIGRVFCLSSFLFVC